MKINQLLCSAPSNKEKRPLAQPWKHFGSAGSKFKLTVIDELFDDPENNVEQVKDRIFVCADKIGHRSTSC